MPGMGWRGAWSSRCPPRACAWGSLGSAGLRSGLVEDENAGKRQRARSASDGLRQRARSASDGMVERQRRGRTARLVMPGMGWRGAWLSRCPPCACAWGTLGAPTSPERERRDGGASATWPNREDGDGGNGLAGGRGRHAAHPALALGARWEPLARDLGSLWLALGARGSVGLADVAVSGCVDEDGPFFGRETLDTALGHFCENFVERLGAA